MTAVDTVEAEVRELVRRRGLDPVEDRAARAVYDAVAGFGPLQRHLDDPSGEEIWISERLAGGSAAETAAAMAWRGRSSEGGGSWTRIPRND